MRCLIRHWKTRCLQLTWQYFDRKFLGSREMVFFSPEKRGVNPWKTACLGIFLLGKSPKGDATNNHPVFFFGFSAFFFFLKNLPNPPPVFAASFHRGLQFFFQRQRCSWLPVLRWCFDHFLFSVDAPKSWLTWVGESYRWFLPKMEVGRKRGFHVEKKTASPQKKPTDFRGSCNKNLRLYMFVTHLSMKSLVRGFCKL